MKIPPIRLSFYIEWDDDKDNRMTANQINNLPDVRDGLSRKERIILYCLDQIQNERKGRNVPTTMLYGRVLEYIDISEEEFQAALTIVSDRVTSV